MPGAQPQHQQTGQPKNERQTRIEERLQPDEDGVALEILEVLAPEPFGLHRLAAIGPHHTNTGERFLHHRAQGGQLGLDPLRLAVDCAAEGLDRDRHEWQRQQRDQGQHGVDRQHQRNRHDEHHGGAGHVHHGGPDHHAHRVQVVGRARHQVAGAVGMEIGQRQPLHPREERVPQVVLEVAGRPDDDPPDQKAEDPADERKAQQQARVEPERATGHVRRQVVDGVAQNPGPCQRQRGGQDETQQTDRELAAKPEHMGDKPGERGTWGRGRSQKAEDSVQNNSSDRRVTRLSSL